MVRIAYIYLSNFEINIDIYVQYIVYYSVHILQYCTLTQTIIRITVISYTFVRRKSANR